MGLLNNYNYRYIIIYLENVKRYDDMLSKIPFINKLHNNKMNYCYDNRYRFFVELIL